jgi:hypothetical protein
VSSHEFVGVGVVLTTVLFKTTVSNTEASVVSSVAKFVIYHITQAVFNCVSVA